MQRPAVLQWDKVVHKGARTADGEPIGYIAAKDNDSIIVLSSHFQEYIIPKSHVKAFDGSQVYLDFLSSELAINKVQQAPLLFLNRKRKTLLLRLL